QGGPSGHAIDRWWAESETSLGTVGTRHFYVPQDGRSDRLAQPDRPINGDTFTLPTAPAGANPSTPYGQPSPPIAPGVPRPARRRGLYSWCPYRASPKAGPIVSIVSFRRRHDAEHEGVGRARKTLLAHQHVEPQRAQIVGHGLEDLGGLEIEDLGIAVAALAAFGAQVAGARELAIGDLVGAAAVHATHAHVVPRRGAERAVQMALAELGAARGNHAGHRRRAAGRAGAAVGRVEVG